MNRRTFLRNGFLATGAILTATHHPVFAAGENKPIVMTVNGPVEPDAIGLALPHEHIMSIFGGPIARLAEYDEAKLFDTVIPYLKKLKGLGCQTLMDCTAAYFGRRPDLLKKISDETGLHILTNTGYYGAAKDRYVPEHAQAETADQLAKRWIEEWQTGINGTGIKPGFIKIGVDAGPLSDLDRKLIQAAARTHRATGLTIASHTSGSHEAVQEQLVVLIQEGVSADAWIWVHAQKVEDPGYLVRTAATGAWIELDGIREETLPKHLECLALLKKKGYLRQVLLSHDGNSFRYGDRPFKPYEALFTHFIPALKSAGYSPEEIHQLTVENPRNAFTVRIRAQG